jgi:O-antigen ligase
MGQDGEVLGDTGTTVLAVTLALILAAYAVVIVSRHQHLALWLSIPVLMWPTTPAEAQAGIVLLLLAGTLIGSRARIRTSAKPLLLAVGFAAVMTTTYVVHGAPATVVPTEARNSFILMLVSVAVIPIATLMRPPLVGTLKAFAVAGAAGSVYVLLAGVYLGGRITMPTYNADAIGKFAALTLLAAISIVALGGRRRWLLLGLPSVVLFMAAQTRAALVVLVLGLGLMWMLRRGGPIRVVIVLVFLALVPLMSAVAVPLQRLLFAQRDANFLEVQSRVDVLQLALEQFRDHPLLGVGWRHFTDKSLESLGVIINAHNDYALIAAEGGIFAIALLLGLMARAITFRTDDRVTAAVLRSILIAAAATMAFGNLITDLRVVLPLWVLLGIAWSMESRRGQASRAERPQRLRHLTRN